MKAVVIHLAVVTSCMGDDLHGFNPGQISETGGKGVMPLPSKTRMRVEELPVEFVATF